MTPLELLESIEGMIDGLRLREHDAGHADAVVALGLVLTQLEKLHDEFTPAKPSIHEEIAATVEALPEEAIAQIPVDGASQHDHYLHGSPKKPSDGVEGEPYQTGYGPLIYTHAPPPKPQAERPAIAKGDRVSKVGGDYRFDGVVVSAFEKLSGVPRCVVEDDRGLLFIYSPSNLAPTPGAGERAE